MDKKHSRTGSNGRKLQTANGKPARPGQSQRRQPSYHNTPAQSHGAGPAGKASLGASRKAETEVVSQDDDETGMASFLQFCATCEKQIVTPGSSILYCSAACRKNDVSRNRSVQGVHSPSAIPTAASYFDLPPADIVPQRSPTVPRPLSLASSDLSLADYEYLHGDSQDIDAMRALSSLNLRDYSTDLPPHSRTRPQATRASTADSSGIPSLTHTPSSSVGTAGSYPYRPLPPRRDPLSGHHQTKSADLVIPTYQTTATSSPDYASLDSSVSTITVFKPAGTDEIDFAKWDRRKRQSEPSSGSLKKLFSHEAMQAPPSRG